MHLAAILLPLTLAAPALAQTPSFTLVGFPAPYEGSELTALSADGRTAAGALAPGARGFLWTAESGRNDFAIGLSWGSTYSQGISGDGRVVVGGGLVPSNDAFAWSAAGGYVPMGTLPGYAGATARDASFDGSVIVGTATSASGLSSGAFRWTAQGGMQGLGAGTSAWAISADGETIVGEISPSEAPVLWTQAGGMQLLTPLGGSGTGRAIGVNFDGSIIVGSSGMQPFATMWVNGSPIELTGGVGSRHFGPCGLSDDGSVVVGDINFNGSRAGVWTQETGVIALADYLTMRGVVIPAGIELWLEAAVSSDGKTFVGRTNPSGPFDEQGFVAIIPPPCPADLDNDGLFTTGQTRDRAVTIDDLLYFLTAFEQGHPSADLDDGSATGTRDNAVEISDLLFFLARFEAGC